MPNSSETAQEAALLCAARARCVHGAADDRCAEEPLPRQPAPAAFPAGATLQICLAARHDPPSAHPACNPQRTTEIHFSVCRQCYSEHVSPGQAPAVSGVQALKHANGRALSTPGE